MERNRSTPGAIPLVSFLSNIFFESNHMKELLKLLAPYAATIFAAIGLYADNQTKNSLMDYRMSRVEEMQNSFSSDINSIKNLLYNIDTKLNVFATKLEERTGNR